MSSASHQHINFLMEDSLPCHPHPKSTQLHTNHKQPLETARAEFWLTEAQMIVIQHQLPHLFSLLPVKAASSRLAAGSRALEEETAQFVNRRRRGRPEGSLTKMRSITQLSERKSQRIKKKACKEQRRSASSSDSNGLDFENSGKDQDYCDRKFENAGSRSDLRPSKSQEKRNFSEAFGSESAEGSDFQSKSRKTLHKKNKKRLHTQTTPQTQCDKKENFAIRNSQNQIQSQIQITIPKCSGPKREKRNSKKRQKSKSDRQDAEDKEKSLKEQTGNAFEGIGGNKGQNRQQQQDNLEAWVHIESLQGGTQFRVNKQRFSEELQSKLIQQRFGPEVEILKQLKGHAQILPFLEPVDEERDGAPDYYATIDDPIDLQTIEFKLANNIYRQPAFFHLDIQKMWRNSREYNSENPFMLKVTNRLQKFYCRLVKNTTKLQQKKESKPNSK